jgi:hypothetical protein
MHLGLTTSMSRCLNDRMNQKVSLCAIVMTKFQLNCTHLIPLPERIVFYLKSIKCPSILCMPYFLVSTRITHFSIYLVTCWYSYKNCNCLNCIWWNVKEFVKRHGKHNSWCLSQTGEIEFQMRKLSLWRTKLDHWNSTRVYPPTFFVR